MSTHNPHFGPGGNCEAFQEVYKGKSMYAPQWVAQNGLSAYEYEAGKGIMASDETLMLIGEEARKHNIHMSLHAPYFISLSSVDPEKRANSVHYIADSLRAAELLGAKIIVVHTGSTAKMAREEALKLAASTIDMVLTQIEDNGVTIGLETMGKLNQLGTLEEVIDLCKMSARLAPVVDFGHLNARSCKETYTTLESYQHIFESIAEGLGDSFARYLHCHFSRIEYTQAGGEKRHLTLADTAWGPEPEPLMQLLCDMKLSPTIISESAGTQTADAKYMQHCFERICQNEH